ncbi:sensor histidine kinase [Paenibacillus sp. PAMC21692]|uniref:cache domain-containing sensor histidine kinase n=1 Tax=Paenibacillus sp. PAMC21692 TaxID=2762320 RepID=UPI00164D9F2A|nr:sensor histidine kinase [Paenibacillus sp. PAMC21692]QNK59081.1 sensor histidine kinase [Paenibacillus sp. PAMC21692]
MRFAWGLKNRLLVALLLISLIPIVVVVVVTSRNYASLVERQVQEVSANVLERSMIRMSNQLEEIGRVSEYIAYQQTAGADDSLSFLKRYLVPDSVSEYERLRNDRDFRTATESLLLSHDYIEGLYLFAEDDTVFASTKGSELQLDYVPRDSEWYNRTLERQGGIYVSDTGYQKFLLSDQMSITFSRALYDPRTKERIGVLLMNCSVKLFDELRNGVLDDQHIAVLSPTGDRLYETYSSEGAPFVPREASGSSLDKRDNRLYVYDTFSSYDWRMVISVSLASVAKQVQSTRTFAIGFGACWAFVAIALSLWIANTFSKPVSRIAVLMKNYDKGLQQQTSLERYKSRTDEIGILYGQYANMLKKIDTLIHERYHSQFIAMSAKMKALEAQINSHFLFNTLATINSIAELEDVDSIAEMSKALGDMFRYSIKLNRDEVTLQEELEHVGNYMRIQSYRYGNKVGLEIDIRPGLENMTMLKLLMQPIVENALYHGLEAKKGKGIVRISSGEDQTGSWLEVSDDGAGIEESKLASLREMLARPPAFEQLGAESGDSRSIGIYNVHARISLYYGEPYGLEVYSAGEGKGATIRLRLPNING